MSDPIQPLGDTVLLAKGRIAPGVERPAGVTDVVPAFGSVAVFYDPALAPTAAIAEWMARALQGDASEGGGEGRAVEVPVAYGGEHGPDLEELAHSAGLSADEAVRRHAAGEYSVAAIGFQPGFPYLTGLAAELQTPRRASPRPRTPAGSVGIGGPYTGVYPSESPGGWNLIGQTPLTLYDASREPRSLLAPGDRVRFREIDPSEFQRLADRNARAVSAAEPQPSRPLFRVVSSGVQSTLQGLGRPGLRHLGVGPGGAMDASSVRQANLLVGNRPDAATVEATLVGPVLECLAPAVVGLAGAVSTARQARFAEGDRVDLRRLHGGVRAYLALPGGVEGPVGRPLVEGDLLGAGEGDATAAPPARAMAGAGWRRLVSGEASVLRVLRGPQAGRFEARAWGRFLAEAYRVSPQSSRMGVRCEGPELSATSDDDAPSQPVCQGVVQVPPDGQPIVLGADAQTLGGYPVIAVVASVDWPVLGQLAPGDPVRFVEIDLADAQRLRRQAERQLAIAAVGVRLAP